MTSSPANQSISLTQSSGRMFALLALLGALVAAQQLLTVPGEQSISRTLHNSLHAPWFFAVTFILCLMLHQLGSVARIVLVAVLATLLALTTEAVQIFVLNRSASWGDLQRNLVGGSLALVFSLFVQPWRPSWARLIGAIATIVALGIYTAMPVWQQLQLRTYREVLMPMVVDFADSRSEQYLGTNEFSHYTRGRASALWPRYEHQHVLRVEFGENEYPTLYFFELMQNWHDFEVLVFELYVLGATPLPLVVAVQYEGSGGTSAYFDFTADPGESIIEVPRDVLVPDAASAVRVRDLLLHTTKGNAGRSLLLGAVYLR